MSRKNDKPFILVVDDNSYNLQLICTLLKEDGYRLAVAQNAWDCFTFLEKQEVDLILLDILMPGLNGLDVCRAIKGNEQTGDIPILFVSTLNDPCDIVDMFKAGGADYISKPLVKEELLARVRVHLYRRAIVT